MNLANKMSDLMSEASNLANKMSDLMSEASNIANKMSSTGFQIPNSDFNFPV